METFFVVVIVVATAAAVEAAVVAAADAVNCSRCMSVALSPAG